jgi:hypothetical protein
MEGGLCVKREAMPDMASPRARKATVTADVSRFLKRSYAFVGDPGIDVVMSIGRTHSSRMAA